jgi:hypothetical protein
MYRGKLTYTTGKPVTTGETMNIAKTVYLGDVPRYDRDGATMAVFCRVKYDGKRLSITGVEGPRKDGDAWGSCGQITLDPDAFVSFGDGWNADKVAEFAATWERWHLNDMRAGCAHQRLYGWHTRPINPSKPTNTYGKHFDGQERDSWNLLGWISPSEHSDGLLGKPCPDCGYAYGTAWLTEEVPQDILEWLAGLPESEREPAWV